jgi:MoaA/NifB/PqqE/SkfB family radical SAM enzyme
LHEINIEHVVNFVGVNADIRICGNNGDPIYHSKFHKLCQRLKENNCKISIITNGSGKTKAWWEKLNDILNENDTLIFSIDGLEDTNHLYRKNAKWKSIIGAVEVFAERKCKLIWKYIIFKHNQNQVKDAKELSVKLKFDHFQIEHSDRWLGEKELMPDREFVNTYYQQQQKVLIDQDFKADMRPICLVNDEPSNWLYIDAEGDFYPCCWMGTYRYRYKSVFSPKQKQFNIKDNTLSNMLENKSVKEFFESTKQFTSAHECCKIQCGVKHD